ncbi:MAG TPA: TIGR00730 family Rossman fold protein [Thermoleophilia bacterium]|nr:TIGR00730 family Rossman fold protein [Thermoleophilia bacterium]
MTSSSTPPDAAGREPLAYRDAGFLDSDEARPVRILSEYLRPLGAFRRRRIHDTIVFFGSARITEDGPLGAYYEAARELARLVTTWSDGLPSPSHRYLVCTGGGPGIMEAANRGASEAGGRSIGLNIGLPHEQRPNRYITRGLSFEFRYFFMRKLWFAYLARAVVAFPGGYGTLDEVFELLTLSQTGKLERPIPVLLYGADFWREIVDFDALVRHGLIAPHDAGLLRLVDDPSEAFEALRAGLRPQDEEAATPDLARSATPGEQPHPSGSSPSTTGGDS